MQPSNIWRSTSLPLDNLVTFKNAMDHRADSYLKYLNSVKFSMSARSNVNCCLKGFEGRFADVETAITINVKSALEELNLAAACLYGWSFCRFSASTCKIDGAHNHSQESLVVVSLGNRKNL